MQAGAWMTAEALAERMVWWQWVLGRQAGRRVGRGRGGGRADGVVVAGLGGPWVQVRDMAAAKAVART
ncbi:hypothetical protein GCM10010168_80890 [Actinoplanes ianthinogenes]|uniref:Uncharacterized protein n=1 Tax=Actinoplanes ianthinogenes TaxID=122358 RepID=A0ABM7LMR0_9ACTN|nr:hypothetical protein Aiant_12340 [Actinoplanes ianthinogenes]GGR49949.1 hypothetical protein GCM10010168_80890 [Actinoplanes ianthinogenes]